MVSVTSAGGDAGAYLSQVKGVTKPKPQPKTVRTEERSPDSVRLSSTLVSALKQGNAASGLVSQLVGNNKLSGLYDTLAQEKNVAPVQAAVTALKQQRANERAQQETSLKKTLTEYHAAANAYNK